MQCWCLSRNIIAMSSPWKIDGFFGIFSLSASALFRGSTSPSLFPQSELAEQRTLAESYRAQLLSLEAELDTLREVSAASKEMLKVNQLFVDKLINFFPNPSNRISNMTTRVDIFNLSNRNHDPLTSKFIVRSDSGANFPFLSQRRTKAMVGQSDALRDRYEDLERRKRSEAEGYQSDVKLLQQKMRRIETQLGRAAISKAKGKIESDVVGEGAYV